MGMAGRADFQEYAFFPQGIFTFFVSCFYASGKILIFLMSFFLVLQRYLSKNSKKNSLHSKVNEILKRADLIVVLTMFSFFKNTEKLAKYLNITHISV